MNTRRDRDRNRGREGREFILICIQVFFLHYFPTFILIICPWEGGRQGGREGGSQGHLHGEREGVRQEGREVGRKGG